MTIETKEFNENDNIDSCKTRRYTAKVDYDNADDKVKSLRYWVEEVNICENTTEPSVEFSISENEIKTSDEVDDSVVKITGNFSKYLSVLNQRLITDTTKVSEAMALVISQILDDLSREISTRSFRKIRLEADDIVLDARDDGLAIDIANTNILMFGGKEDYVNEKASIESYLPFVLLAILQKASPEPLK